jgi:hypothetical protein
MVETRTESDGDGDGGDEVEEAVSATGSFCDDAGSDGLLGSTGESGSTGGAGGSNIGETGSRNGGSRGECSRGAGGGVFGVGAGWEGGVTAGGVGGGGVPRLDEGEMRKSLFSTLSRRSSISVRLFLDLFAGGGAVSGDGAAGVAGGGVVARAGVLARAGASEAALADLPRLWRRRCRRRRFPAEAESTDGAGKLQVTVRT